MSRPPTSDFATALLTLRSARGLSQEQFDVVSGRTYISKLEQGEKQPTLRKVDELSTVLQVHPLTLLTVAYCNRGSIGEVDRLLSRVREEFLSVVG